MKGKNEKMKGVKMSLRKGLALLMVTVFALNSVIPASAATISAVTNDNAGDASLYMPTASATGTANGDGGIVNKLTFTASMANGDSVQAGVAASTIIARSDGHAFCDSAAVTTACNLSSFGIGRMEINGNNLAYTELIGEGNTAGPNTSGVMTINAANGFNGQLLFPNPPAGGLFGCIAVRHLSSPYVVISVATVLNAQTLSVDGSVVATGHTDTDNFAIGQFAIDGSDIADADGLADAINGNAQNITITQGAYAPGAVAINTILAGYHIRNQEEVVLTLLPNRLTGTAADMDAIAVTASADTFLVNAVGLNTTPSTIAGGNTAAASNAAGGATGALNATLTEGGAVCHYSTTGGAAVAMTGTETVAVVMGAEIPSTLAVGNGTLETGSSGTAIPAGTSVSTQYFNYTTPNATGTANENFFTGLNNATMIVGSTAAIGQVAKADGGTPTVLGSTVAANTSLSISPDNTSSATAIRSAAVLVESDRTTDNLPKIATSFRTTTVALAGVGITANNIAAGASNQAINGNTAVFTNGAATLAFTVTPTTGSFTMTGFRVRLESSGTTAASGRKGYLGALADVTTDGTTAATTGDFGLLALDNTVGDDAILDAGTAAQPVVGTTALTMVAGAVPATSLRLEPPTGTTGYIIATGDEADTAGANANTAVLIADTNPNVKPSIGTAAGGGSAANEANNIILAARWSGATGHITIANTAHDGTIQRLFVEPIGTWNIGAAGNSLTENEVLNVAVSGGNLTGTTTVPIATVLAPGQLDPGDSFGDLEMVAMNSSGTNPLVAAGTTAVNYGDVRTLNAAAVTGGNTSTKSVAALMATNGAASVFLPPSTFVKGGKAGTTNSATVNAVLTGPETVLQNGWRAVHIPESGLLGINQFSSNFEDFTSNTDNTLLYCLEMPSGVDLNNMTSLTANRAAGVTATTGGLAQGVRIVTTGGLLANLTEVRASNTGTTATGARPARVCFSLHNTGLATTDGQTTDSVFVAFGPGALVIPNTVTDTVATLKAIDNTNSAAQQEIGVIDTVELLPNNWAALSATELGGTAPNSNVVGTDLGTTPLLVTVGGDNSAITTVNATGLLATNAQLRGDAGVPPYKRIANAASGSSLVGTISVCENPLAPDAFRTTSRSTSVGAQVDHSSDTIYGVAGTGDNQTTVAGESAIRIVANNVGSSFNPASTVVVTKRPMFTAAGAVVETATRVDLTTGITVAAESITIPLDSNNTMTAANYKDAKLVPECFDITGVGLTNNFAAVGSNTSFKVQYFDHQTPGTNDLGNTMFHSTPASFGTVGSTIEGSPYAVRAFAGNHIDFLADSDAVDDAPGATTRNNPATAADNARIVGDATTPGSELATDLTGPTGTNPLTSVLNVLEDGEFGLVTKASDSNVGIPGSTATPITGFSFVDAVGEASSVTAASQVHAEARDSNGTTISSVDTFAEADGSWIAHLVGAPGGTVIVNSAVGAARSEVISVTIPAEGESTGATNEIEVVSVNHPASGTAVRVPGDAPFSVTLGAVTGSNFDLATCTSYTMGGVPAISLGNDRIAAAVPLADTTAGANIEIACKRTGESDVTVSFADPYTRVVATGTTSPSVNGVKLARKSGVLVAKGTNIGSSDNHVLINAANPAGKSLNVAKSRQRKGTTVLRFTKDAAGVADLTKKSGTESIFCTGNSGGNNCTNGLGRKF